MPHERLSPNLFENGPSNQSVSPNEELRTRLAAVLFLVATPGLAASPGAGRSDCRLPRCRPIVIDANLSDPGLAGCDKSHHLVRNEPRRQHPAEGEERRVPDLRREVPLRRIEFATPEPGKIRAAASACNPARLRRAAADFLVDCAGAIDDYEEELGDIFDAALNRALRRRRDLLACYADGSRPDARALSDGWIASPHYWAA